MCVWILEQSLHPGVPLKPEIPYLTSEMFVAVLNCGGTAHAASNTAEANATEAS